MGMIHDKYTDLQMSRQYKYQLRMRDKGKCRICGGDLVNKTYCEKHRIFHNRLAVFQYHKSK